MSAPSRRAPAVRRPAAQPCGRSWAMLVKELIQLRRDRATLPTTVSVPLMQRLLAHPAVARLHMQPQLDDGGLLANQLAQLLPIPEPEKFALLAEADPLVRLDRLLQKLEEIDGS